MNSDKKLSPGSGKTNSERKTMRSQQNNEMKGVDKPCGSGDIMRLSLGQGQKQKFKKRPLQDTCPSARAHTKQIRNQSLSHELDHTEYAKFLKTEARIVSEVEGDESQLDAREAVGLDALAAAAGDHEARTAARQASKEVTKNSRHCQSFRNHYSSSSSEDNDESLEHCTENSEIEKANKNETKWFSNLEALKRYKESYGDCIVPRGYTDNPRLGAWVAVQRKQYRLMLDNKQSAMTQERIDLLNKLGFAWNAQEVAWDRHLRDFQTFRSEVGHGNVPVKHAKYPQLHLWVREQRRHYALMQQGKKSHMTHARVEELNRIGFCWDTCEAQWTERLQELTEFQRKHGHCVVPANYSTCPKLGSWVSNQRRVYKNAKHGKPGYMPEDRVQALEAIGFTWSPRDK